DQLLNAMAWDMPSARTRIAKILSILGRERIRILTFIFKHMDITTSGFVTSSEIEKFDLLLFHNATMLVTLYKNKNIFFFSDMTKEDAVLFLNFGRLQPSGHINILQWLLTWKRAVSRARSVKVMDSFLD
ncbi:hypothetical protein RFI_37246, partial [Reticulomyxa filosa]